MGHLFRTMTSFLWLLLWASLAGLPAYAQSAQYPPADMEWDGASYRALLQRVESKGLPLPTMSDAKTKPVFERMVAADNIPLRMGLNRDLAIAIRFQRLDSALPAIHKLVVMYSVETQKGKPYAAELARLMVYEAKVSAVWLDLTEPYLSSLEQHKRYDVLVGYLDKVKVDARQFYAGLVHGTTETSTYSKPDILRMIAGALAALPSYHPILTDQDRQHLTQKLTQQISATTDQELKTAMTELRDTLEHRRIPT
jgi:hypothetical protein